MNTEIPIAGPWITQKEIDYVSEAAASAWYLKANTYCAQFELKMAQFVGRKFAISLPSGTSAIHLALAALGIGPGDEVIVPEITWIATSAPISYVEAKPVFVDVDPDTWCISLESLRRAVTKCSKAIILVDLYGNMPDVGEILSFAAASNIAVIEDAAQAIGSEFKGKRAGSFGDASMFSFHGSKTLTTGEGGMLLTDRQDIYERCSILREHGRTPASFWNTEVGFKYKMGDLQAALGLAQLERIEELLQRKQDIFAWYSERLSKIPDLRLNSTPQDVLNTYWMVTAIVPTEFNMKKEEFIARLKEKGIHCRPFFYPLSALPAYADIGPKDNKNPVAYRISPYGINLPSALSLTRDDVDYVCDNLIEILQTSKQLSKGSIVSV